MSLRVFHFADQHASPERADEYLKSMRVAYETCRDQKVDLIVSAGDLWDKAVLNTKKFPQLVEAFRRLADVAPVAIIYGTPTHDADGSLEIFEELESKFGITILQPGIPYQLTDALRAIPHGFDALASAKALLFGVPEPSKKWLMSGTDSIAKAEQTVRDSLRHLFAGLGVIRRQYASLPCVMLYHGHAGGARRTDGEILDLGSGMRPSIDDLKMVGANYIAGGDEHLPQELGQSIDLNFFYSGSIYLKNFGETHDAGANLVTIRPAGVDSFSAGVERISFGHPVNQTIRATVEPALLGDPELSVNLSKTVKPGNRIKLEITCTKEEAPSIREDDFLARLKVAGAVEGSVVEKKILLTETVRAEEITTVQGLVEKVAVWFRQSAKEFTEKLRSKVKKVEDTAPENAVDTGAEMRFRHLSTFIKGSRGFLKKNKKEEIFIDWAALGPGVIAFIGPNGFGKSTTFDFGKPHAHHPVTRGPMTLKNHFKLRDSMIEDEFLEEISGAKYKLKIAIDAGIASGKTEYYLFKDIGAGYELVPGIEGRQKEYVEAIVGLFGSLDVYMRTAYTSQSPTPGRPDIKDATKEEKKALIAELAGKDWVVAYQEKAKELGDEVERGLLPKQAEIDARETGLPDVGAIQERLAEDGERLLIVRSEMSNLQITGTEQAKIATDLGVQAQANKQHAEQADEAGRLAREAAGKAGNAQVAIDRAQVAVNGRAQAQADLTRFTELSAALVAQNSAYQDHLNAISAEQSKVNELRTAYDRGVSAHRAVQEGQRSLQRAARAEYDRVEGEARQEFEALQQRYRGTVNTAASDERRASELESAHWRTVDRIISELSSLEMELSRPIKDSCHVCKQALQGEALAHVHADRKADEDKAVLKRQEIERATKTANEAKAETERLRKIWVDLDDTPPKPEPRPDYVETIEIFPDLPAFQAPLSTIPAWDNAERQRLTDALLYLDEANIRAKLSEADQASVRIEELTKQLSEFQSAAEREATRERALRSELRPTLDAEYQAAQQVYEASRQAYREAQGREATVQAAIAAAQKRLDEMDSELKTIEDLRAALTTVQTEMAEWRLVEAAIIGVRDLELDALAPHIANVASRLLESSGRPGMIEIDTTRISAGGKRARQIEDFIIFYVGTDGERQDIATCSGGEMVWIRKALYDAFSVIRIRNARIRFTTGFLDETDGALFPEDRVDYYRMLLAGHEESGRYQTILITQSAEIAAMAQKILDVRELKGRAE